MLIILIQMIIMVMEYQEIVLRKKILGDETGSSLPDKDGILLNNWIDDEEADRLLHLYSKRKLMRFSIVKYMYLWGSMSQGI